MRLSGNTVLITGGTSGIGRGLAEAFHRQGNQVIIAGRRQNLIDEILATHPGMHGLFLDVARPDAVETLATRVLDRFPNLNVLVNNAGIASREDLSSGKIDISGSQSIIDTNVVGVLRMTAALLPALMRQSSATIITTTSSLAFLPHHYFPTYCASKAFLHSWLQSLRFQLRSTAVEVLELAPPYVQTELGGPAQATDPAAMPLDQFIAEVIRLLANQDHPGGEIIVEKGMPLRWAERSGQYDQIYAAVNGS